MRSLSKYLFHFQYLSFQTVFRLIEKVVEISFISSYVEMIGDIDMNVDRGHSKNCLRPIW